MTAIRGGYATILNDCKILYLPSCLIVEMMTKLYSQVARINLSHAVHNVVPDLLVLLRRLTRNLTVTAEAYRNDRIRFFIGDWKSDKLRARKLFFNLMSRLGYLSDLLGDVDKGMIYASIEEMTAEWTSLDGIMEDKCDYNKCLNSCPRCRYFRSDSMDNWQTVMARIILDLDAGAEYPDDDTYLILLCYDRIGAAFLRAIEALQRRGGGAKRFSSSRILCVSNEDVAVTCPKCGLMTENFRHGSTEVIHKGYANAAHPLDEKKTIVRRVAPRETTLRGRYPMPPSLAGISR